MAYRNHRIHPTRRHTKYELLKIRANYDITLQDNSDVMHLKYADLSASIGPIEFFRYCN